MPAISLPRQLARTQLFSLGVPDHFMVAPDGATVLFVRSRAGDDPVSCLWALEVGSGAERVLADPAELPGGSAEQLPTEERTRRERGREFDRCRRPFGRENSARTVTQTANRGQTLR